MHGLFSKCSSLLITHSHFPGQDLWETPAPALQRFIGKSQDSRLLPCINSRGRILFSKGIQLWCQQKSIGIEGYSI